MFRLALVVSSALVLCYAGIPAQHNEVSSRNRQLIETLYLIENNLAHSYKDTDKQKREFSLISHASLLYVQSADTHSVVRKLHDFLIEPSDVIAADSLKDLAQLKSLIAQPVNDIKRACRPHTTDAACIDILTYYYQQQEAKCPGYHNHVQLRDTLEKLIVDEDYQQFLHGAVAESERGVDLFAVAYFLEQQPMLEVFDKFRDMYKDLKEKKYPCRFYGGNDL